MTIGRMTDFPYPERVDSIENMGQYLKSLYRSLVEEQVESITDLENMVIDSQEVGNLTIVTSFKPTVDNAVDIGATTLRFKDLYLSGNLNDDTVTLTVANAKTAYDHSQIAGGDSVHVSTTENTQWDAAYSKRVDTWGDGLQISSFTASVDFNATNLKITSTELNTIQDIDTSANPTFTSITIDDIKSVTDADQHIFMDTTDEIRIHPGYESTDIYFILKSTDNTTANPQFYPSADGYGQLGLTGSRWNALFVSGISTLGTINCNEITVADGYGINLQEDITFTGATGVNQLKIPDNLLDAWSVQQGSNKYMTFDTVDDEEDIFFYKSVDILHTATHADDHALEIDTDAATLGDVKAIDIDYITGNIVAGTDEGILLINIDRTLATGGDIFALEVLATDQVTGSTGIYGLKIGPEIGPVHQDSGEFIDPTLATNDTPRTHVANMADGALGSTTSIFLINDDYIIISANDAFQDMELVFSTPASKNIRPTFHYSISGIDTFAEFTPVDGTDGCRHTGVISWDADDVTGGGGHVADSTTGKFAIKIIRTKAGNMTTPVLGYAKTAKTVEYIWDKNGDVNIRKLAISTVVNAATDTDKFLVLDASNNVDFRTGANVLADIGAESADATIVKDADFNSAGLCATDGSGTYSIVTDNSATWDNAAASGHNMSTHGDVSTYNINTSGSATVGFTTVSSLVGPASQLNINTALNQNVALWSTLSSGNPYFYIYGWDTSAVKYLRMRVENDGTAVVDAEEGLKLTSGAGAVVLPDGIKFVIQEEIELAGATGENFVTLPDNLADAWSIKEGATAYQTFVTTNSGEKIVFGKLFEAPTACKIGNLTLGDGSITDSSNAINFGNEALSTTGTLGCGALTLSGDLDTSGNDISMGTLNSAGDIGFRTGFAPSDLGGTGITAYVHEGANADALAIYGYSGVGIFTNQTEILHVDLDGNVGIGIITPDTQLEVYGGTASGLTDVIKIKAGADDTSSGGALVFQAGFAPEEWLAGKIGTISVGYGTTYKQDMVFYTNTGGSAGNLTEKMRIDNQGNVGVGTASPDALFQVVTAGEIEVANASGGARKKTALGVSANYGWIDSYHVGTGSLPLWLNPNRGNVFIGDAPSGGACVNTKMTMGLTINQEANDDEILAFKSSDVAHGCTGQAETDTYGFIKKLVGGTGGMWLQGMGEQEYGLFLQSVYTSDNTTKTAAGLAPCIIDVYKINGAGVAAQGADANTLVVRSNGSTRFIVDEDGDILYDGTSNPFQDHDDIELVSELDEILSKKIKPNKIKDKEVASLGIVNEAGFVSTKKKNMLLYGAIRQLNEKIKVLEARLDE